MKEPEYVPVDTFITVIKMLSLQISELTASVAVLQSALMQSRSLPISSDEMKRLGDLVRNDPAFRAGLAAIEGWKTDQSSADELLAILKGFSGTIQ